MIKEKSKYRVPCTVLLVLAVFAMLLSACGQRIPQYDNRAEYEPLFTAEDTDAIREIKSFVLWHTELYNNEEFKDYAAQYYALTDQEIADMVGALTDTAALVRTERQALYLTAVFLDSDPDRAQVGAVIRTVVTGLDGSTDADYTDRYTYSLYRTSGEWQIEEEKIENVGFYDQNFAE